jgi:DNA-binding NtrC family response regulator
MSLSLRCPFCHAPLRGEKTEHAEAAGLPCPWGEANLRTRLEAVERQTVQAALTACEGHRKRTAALLGISLRMLYYRLPKLGLE